MKIFNVLKTELKFEVSFEPACDNCGDDDVQIYYVPNWRVHRCEECLMEEAKKFGYTIIEDC